VKGPTGAPERKPFDTRRESTEREWFVVRVHAGWVMVLAGLFCQAVVHPHCAMLPYDGLATTSQGMLRVPVSK
jgi:hypothetical protein